MGIDAVSEDKGVSLNFVSSKCSESLSGFHGVEGAREFKQQLLIKRLRLGFIIETVMGQIGKHPQRIVTSDVVEVQIHHLLVQRHRGVQSVLLQKHVRREHQHFVFQGVPREGRCQRVERGPCKVVFPLHAQQVCPRIHFHGQGQRVQIEVVGDEQTQFNGVVGDEFGRGRLQGVELALGPIEITAVVTDAGIAKFGFGRGDRL